MVDKKGWKFSWKAWAVFVVLLIVGMMVIEYVVRLLGVPMEHKRIVEAVSFGVLVALLVIFGNKKMFVSTGKKK